MQGEEGLTPDWGAEILHAVVQLILSATTRAICALSLKTQHGKKKKKKDFIKTAQMFLPPRSLLYFPTTLTYEA